MQPSPALKTDHDVRLRLEHFGALAWRTQPRRIYRLGRAAAAVLLLHGQSRQAGTALPPIEPLGLTKANWYRAVTELQRQNLLVTTQETPALITPADIRNTRKILDADTPKQPILKPLWAHLQPFTRCNQHCIHCYCHGSPKADPFLLPVATWHGIVGTLDDYGVLDIYITGGESLLYDSFFTIAEDILSRGMGFGLSTNATALPTRTLARLQGLRIETIQVSLDGAHAARHEFIRGAPGSFQRTLDGITRIAQFSTPLINTVVNRQNLGELEDIVKLGLQHSCSRFKFFPQKPVGRSGVALTLSDDEIINRLVPECARLADAYDVEIETIDPGKPCGSGSLGFAVDQHGDIYPCIFGVADPAQRCGNILRDDLNDVWFGSSALEQFRGETSPVCRRCEKSQSC